VQSALKDLDGVLASDIDLGAREVVIRFDAGKVQPDALAKAVTDSGYPGELKTAEN